MNTVVKNGRLCMVDDSGSITPIPLSMDEARSMKMSREERIAQAEELCPASGTDDGLSMECE